MKALCPISGNPGKPVRSITVRHLVQANQRERVGGHDWFFCDSPSCDVVYFEMTGDLLRRSDLAIRVGIKEERAPHLVCYCFNHTLESIRDEVQRAGKSTVVDSVTARVQAGECDCERLNPKGTCCLGDLRAAAKEALGAKSPETDSAPSIDCCKETQ